MERDYAKLDIKEFGTVLLQSYDLDPVYVALHTMGVRGQLGYDQLARWLLGYMLCYHCGAACYFSDATGEEFWKRIYLAAHNEAESPVGGRWPRSHERRHWRGRQALQITDELYVNYREPEGFIKMIVGADDLTAAFEGKERPGITFQGITERVKQHRGFGDWAAFKIADIVDRLGLIRVDFAYEDVTIYRDPVLAAEMLVRRELGLPANVSVKPGAVRGVFDSLIEYFDNYSAPPLFDRAVGLQEVETILCKWKSSQNGRYPLYNDIREISEGIVPWIKVSRTAFNFAEAMPILPIAAGAANHE